MRRGFRLLVMLLCCAVLLTAYVSIGDQEATSEDTTEQAEDTSYFMLYEDQISDLNSITVQPKGEDSYTLLSDMGFDDNGNLLGVYNALGQPFVVEGNEDFTLNSTAWQMMIVCAQYIPATASYPALDRDACGLTDPDAVMTILHKDGTSRKIQIGHKTSDGVSCYLSMDGDTNVYLVPYDLYDTVCQPLKEHHTLPASITEDTSDAVQIALVGSEDGQLIFTKGSTDNSVLSWHASSPLTHDGDTTRINAFIEGLCAISAEHYVTTVSDMDGLAQYGLDQPKRLIASFQDGTIRDIHIGNDAGNGTVYVRMDKTGDIYTISRTQIAFAGNAGLNTLLDRYVALIPVYSIHQALVHTKDADYLLGIEYENDDDNLGQAWSLNGHSLTQDQFSSCYASIIGLSFSKSAMNEMGGDLLAEITFTYRTGEAETVTYQTYDDYYTLAVTSGGGRFLVRLTEVQKMLGTLESY